jgi:hypothetical protein
LTAGRQQGRGGSAPWGRRTTAAPVDSIVSSEAIIVAITVVVLVIVIVVVVVSAAATAPTTAAASSAATTAVAVAITLAATAVVIVIVSFCRRCRRCRFRCCRRPISLPQEKNELPSSVDEMKSDDDEDQHSYQTCSSGHNVIHAALFDSADSARFPQGDISPYVVNDHKFRLSWTMMTYGFNCVNAKGERRLQQCCLGIYKCPSTGCKFVRNA